MREGGAMFKVFLVDDEIVIREGIRDGFPWDESGFTLCGEAPDGEMAFPMIADLKPDILITDIRMPFMDGLALSRRVAQALPWTSIIILSGYDDFQYAQEAISIGVKQYLLKPVTPQKLAEALSQTADKIQEQRARLMRAEDMAPLNQPPTQQERLLARLLKGPVDDPLLREAAGMGLPLDGAEYLVMLLGEAEPARLPALKAGLQRVVQAQMPWVAYTTVLPTPALLLAQPPGDSAQDSLEERAYALARALEHEAGRSGEQPPAIAIGSPVSRAADLPQALASARAVLRMVKDQAPRIVGALDVDLSASLDQVEGSLPLGERLRYAAWQDADQLTEQHFASMGDLATQSVLVLNFLLMDVLLAATRIIRQSGGEPAQVLPPRMLQQAEMLALSREPQLALSSAKAMVRAALRYRDEHLASRYGETLRRACAYIDANCHKPAFSLQDVAGHVALSANHFSTVFSQEMGLTFTEYLTKTRLDRARHLLGTTRSGSAEIAAAIGYNDPHYFSYLFKKQVGLSPREFRRSLQTKA